MYRYLTIILTLCLMIGVALAGQTGDNISISGYFASQALIAQSYVNTIEPPIALAVLELEGKGIEQDEAGSLSDRLSTLLFETGRYDVISRDMMAQTELKLKLDSIGCIGDDCYVEAGKLLNVKQVVGGSITLVDSTYTVSVKIMNVETGEIIKTATYDTQENLDKVLSVGAQSLVSQLTAKKEEPEQQLLAEETFPVGEPEEPPIITEDLFAAPVVGDIYQFEPKSTQRAFFYSLLFPGSGEYYAGSRVKPIAFIGAEALIWTGYFIFNGKGDDKRKEYQTFADEHYKWWDYMQWWVQLDTTKQNAFSHRLPWDDQYNSVIKNQEYYENIGKYNQFQLGWDDIDQYPPIPGVDESGEPDLSYNRNFYLNLRKEANDFYQNANTMIMLSLGNRIISAFDAALTAKKYNKGKKQYSFKFKAKDFGNGNVPMLTCTYRF